MKWCIRFAKVGRGVQGNANSIIRVEKQKEEGASTALALCAGEYLQQGHTFRCLGIIAADALAATLA